MLHNVNGHVRTYATQLFPDLELTKEDEKPACNVRVRGGVVYTWEEKLYQAIDYTDSYYSGKMKTVFIHKPINSSAVAVRGACHALDLTLKAANAMTALNSNTTRGKRPPS